MLAASISPIWSIHVKPKSSLNSKRAELHFYRGIGETEKQLLCHKCSWLRNRRTLRWQPVSRHKTAR